MSSCPRCGHRYPTAPRIVRETAALILLRTGYSRDQIAEHSSVAVAPLDRAGLTLDLLEAGADHLRAVGFTYRGVWDAVAALRVELGGSPEPAAVPAAAAEQLLLDGPQP